MGLMITLVLFVIIRSDLFLDPWTFPKWCTLYLFAGALTLISVFRPISLPRLSKLEIYLCVAATTVFFCGIILYSGNRPVTATLDGIVYLTLILISFQSFQKNPSSFTKFVWLLALLPLLTFLEVGFEIFRDGLNLENLQEDYYLYSGSFGHRNLTAQFLGISILAQFHLLRLTSDLQKKFLLTVLLVIGICLLGFYYCRSVLIGVGLACVGMIWLRKRAPIPDSRRSPMSIGMILCLGIIALIAGSKYWSKFSDVKAGNVNYRLELWKNTWDIVRDRPLGLGPGNFEYGYVPYAMKNGTMLREKTIDQSPHNEFLRFASESGILYPFLLLLLGFSVWRKYYTSSPTDLHTPLIFSFGLYSLTDGFFQPYLENPVPFYVSAVMFGFMLSSRDSVTIPQWILSRIFLFGLSVFELGSASAQAVSRYLVIAENRNTKTISLACKVYPANWKACFFEALDQLRSNQLDLARQSTERILKRTPYLFVVWPLYAEIIAKSGDPERACKIMRSYDGLFLDTSTLTPKIESSCVRYPSKERALLPFF